CLLLQTTKILSSERFVMGSVTLEPVPDETQNASESLLAIYYLALCAARFRVNVLAHIQLRDRFPENDRVNEVGSSLVVPNIPALKFGSEVEFALVVPFLEVTNAVVPSAENLLHCLHSCLCLFLSAPVSPPSELFLCHADSVS